MDITELSRYASHSPNYDVSADGERFLPLRGEGGGSRSATKVSLILNWFEELRRLVPAE